MNVEAMLFILIFAAGTAMYLSWGFHNLAAERWQILATVPERKDADTSSSWHGTNFTYYGFFTANAYAGGTALYLFLATSARASLATAAIVLASLLLIGATTSRLIAKWVEGKKSGFTAGGASFLGILAIPWAAMVCEHIFSPHAHGTTVLPMIAAGTIAYTCGEAFGRLACISFGCCYGKPVNAAPPALRRLFERWHFVFTGATKKVAYEGGLEGTALIPIQAITATVLSILTAASLALFLTSFWKAAFLTAGIGSQIWRIISEFLRADDRGKLKFSAYQWMSLLSIPYMIGAALLLPTTTDGETPSILGALHVLSTPLMLLALQLLWMIVFIYTGKSSVTGSIMSFHVRRENL